MTEENKERAVEMFKMYLDGSTYQEIADKYGITKQRVHAILGNPNSIKNRNYDFINYKGLKNWMEMNKISIAYLHRILHPNVSSNNACRTKEKLMGNIQFKLKDVIAIINESGLTFEQLFMQE